MIIKLKFLAMMSSEFSNKNTNNEKLEILKITALNKEHFYLENLSAIHWSNFPGMVPIDPLVPVRSVIFLPLIWVTRIGHF